MSLQRLKSKLQILTAATVKQTNHNSLALYAANSTHNLWNMSLGNIGVRFMWYIVSQIWTFVLNNDLLCMCMCICAIRIHALQYTISTNFYQSFFFRTCYETGPNFQISVTIWQESRHDYTGECRYSMDLKLKVRKNLILRKAYNQDYLREKNNKWQGCEIDKMRKIFTSFSVP